MLYVHKTFFDVSSIAYQFGGPILPNHILLYIWSVFDNDFKEYLLYF